MTSLPAALACSDIVRRLRTAVTACCLAAAMFTPNAAASLSVLSPPTPAMATPATPAAADEPWLRPYTGPTRTDIDATTLDSKVLCGY